MPTPDRIAALLNLYVAVVAHPLGRLEECVAEAVTWSRDLLDRGLVSAPEA